MTGFTWKKLEELGFKVDEDSDFGDRRATYPCNGGDYYYISITKDGNDDFRFTVGFSYFGERIRSVKHLKECFVVLFDIKL